MLDSQSARECLSVREHFGCVAEDVSVTQMSGGGGQQSMVNVDEVTRLKGWWAGWTGVGV